MQAFGSDLSAVSEMYVYLKCEPAGVAMAEWQKVPAPEKMDPKLKEDLIF